MRSVAACARPPWTRIRWCRSLASCRDLHCLKSAAAVEKKALLVKGLVKGFRGSETQSMLEGFHCIFGVLPFSNRSSFCLGAGCRVWTLIGPNNRK
ncbi:hypothetical protein ACFX1W_039712 [Malus domestica]